MKTIFIEDIVKDQPQTLINGYGWHLAKPENFKKKFLGIYIRIYWAWRVLIGKAIAVHYAEDILGRSK